MSRVEHQQPVGDPARDAPYPGANRLDDARVSPLSNTPSGVGLVSPFTAAAKHIPLVLLVAVIGAVIGGVVAFVKPSTYSATATLTVGRSTASANSVPGYASALESLAGSYARIATSERVRDRAARELGRRSLGASISATQIPASSLLKVTATGDDHDTVQRAANAAAYALIAYVATADTNPEALLSEYERAQRLLSAANEKVSSLRAAGRSGTDLTNATAAQAAARLRASALEEAYPQARLNEGRVAAEVLTPADDVATDRLSTFRLYVLIGLLVGGLVAVVYATFRVNRRGRTA